MSNNRGNTNRRRTRGGNRSQSNNQFPNRIDSRARGNAPQLLDKYKKLAQDAQMNGDRVQAEQYLQFADHYYRVLADNKSRQDEQRPNRDDNRDDNRGDNRGARNSSDDDGDERQDHRQNDRQSDRPDDRQEVRPRKQPRRPRKNEGQEASQGREQSEGADAPPEENPFTRTGKPAAPKGADKPKGKPRRSAKPAKDSGANGLDPSALPPAIGDDNGDAPKPRRRTRRAASEDDGDGAEAAA